MFTRAALKIIPLLVMVLITTGIRPFPIFSGTSPSIPNCQCTLTYRSLYLVYPHLRGSDIVELQERLFALGFFRGEIDGIFGVSVDSAVKEFQKAFNMEPTGFVTDSVWLRMSTSHSRTLPVISDLPPGERRIVVNINTLVLTFYVNNETIKEYPIAIGKWHTPTPIGEFAIIEKDYAPGGAFGTRWMGLNVPWGGYGIHGTNKPWSVGSAASAGCIRMFNEDVEELFELTPIKTRVEIIGGKPEGNINRILRSGDTGHDVQVLQYCLRLGAFDAGPLDGRFGPRVEAAVKEMQKFYGFPVTGRVGLNELFLLGLR
ncbi:MAG: L,D-transpeptidase family protein [Firmicutes bacterium]|nr:L,D-transpeptidase family protein [Bacillota bacterium]